MYGGARTIGKRGHLSASNQNQMLPSVILSTAHVTADTIYVYVINKYTYLIEQVFFSVCQKKHEATKDFLLMDFMSEA